MRHHADPRVQDPELLAEIELYAEVVIAASESSGPLSALRLDHVLGLPTVPTGAPTPEVLPAAAVLVLPADQAAAAAS